MARKTNLEKIIEDYSYKSCYSQYALGILDMAKQIKTIRDQLKNDYDDLWRNRQGAPPQAKGTITVLRHVIAMLDCIDEPQNQVSPSMENEPCQTKP